MYRTVKLRRGVRELVTASSLHELQDTEWNTRPGTRTARWRDRPREVWSIDSLSGTQHSVRYCPVSPLPSRVQHFFPKQEIIGGCYNINLTIFIHVIEDRKKNNKICHCTQRSNDTTTLVVCKVTVRHNAKHWKILPELRHQLFLSKHLGRGWGSELTDIRSALQ